jgi:hypothetical protein
VKNISHPALAEQEAGPARAWARFWFNPADPFPLHLTRLLTGLLLLAWLLPLAGEVPALFGLGGWFDLQALKEAARLQNPPKPIGRDQWSLLYLAGTSTAGLKAIYWASIGVLVLFTAGVATRLTAVLAWAVVVSFTANPLLDAELDPLFQLLTLYLALGYLLLGLWDWKLSWPERILGPWDSLLFARRFQRPERAAAGSVAANLAVRLLQVHFAIVLVTSGLHKLQVGEWWAGTAHWFNLYPPLEATPGQTREHLNDPLTFLGMLNIAAYATLAWQIMFPTFAWRGRWWRLVLLGGAGVGWLGLAYLYRLPLMGAAFTIGCLAYVTGPEWALVGRALLRVLPFRRLGAAEASEAPRPAAATREPVGSLHAIRER